VLTDALQAAFDRIEDFLAVQSGDGGAIALEPVMRLQESVGIDDDARAAFVARLSDVQPNAHAGAVLLGLIVGLCAAELDRDKHR
jgi:hypothetical protein